MNVTLLFPLGSWIVRAISFVINIHLKRGANDLRAYQPFWGVEWNSHVGDLLGYSLHIVYKNY